MTLEEFEGLKPGDLVRHARGDWQVYVVTACHGDRVTAVRTIDMTNPVEWIRLDSTPKP